METLIQPSEIKHFVEHAVIITQPSGFQALLMQSTGSENTANGVNHIVPTPQETKTLPADTSRSITTPQAIQMLQAAAYKQHLVFWWQSVIVHYLTTDWDFR